MSFLLLTNSTFKRYDEYMVHRSIPVIPFESEQTASACKLLVRCLGAYKLLVKCPGACKLLVRCPGACKFLVSCLQVVLVLNCKLHGSCLQVVLALNCKLLVSCL